MRSFLFLFSVLLGSCTSSQKMDSIQYQGNRQMLSADKDSITMLRKIVPDSVFVGTELSAKIFSISPALRIEKVFMQCDLSKEVSVDTVTLDVTGCINELIFQNDTIRIAFKPTVAGKHDFPEFNILTRDNHRIFRLERYTFDYNVVENTNR